MAKNHREESGADETFGLLGESSYDFIDDRSVSATDEESTLGISESLASLREVLYEAEEAADTSVSTKAPLSKACQLEDESLHTTQNHPEECGHCGAENIEVQQREQEDEDVAASCLVVQTLHLCQEGLAYEVSLRQLLSTRTVPLHAKPFKILYWGDGNESQKDSILHKIATALAASDPLFQPRTFDPRPSTYNVLPLSSFAHNASPEVVLVESSGITLEVEEVKTIRTGPSHTVDGHMDIWFKDGTKASSRRRDLGAASLQGWNMPDLAIVKLSRTNDAGQSGGPDLRQAFLNRHQLPFLMISDEILLNEVVHSSSINLALPHIRLERQPRQPAEAAITKYLPIDLPHFLQLDALRLNRSIACVLRHEAFPSPKHLPSQTWKKLYANGLDRLGFSRPNLPISRLRALFTILLVIVVSLVSASMVSSPVALNIWGENPISKGSGPLRHTLAVLTPVQGETAIIQGARVRSSKQVERKSLEKDDQRASEAVDYTSKMRRVLDHIEVQALGASYVLAKVPDGFRATHVMSTLCFRLSRNATTLKTSLIELPGCGYALDVPREEAYGPLLLNVWFSSDPKINRQFEIDFGRKWSLKAFEAKRKRAFFRMRAFLLGPLKIQMSRDRETNGDLRPKLSLPSLKVKFDQLDLSTQPLLHWATRGMATGSGKWQFVRRATQDVTRRLVVVKLYCQRLGGNGRFGRALLEELGAKGSNLVEAHSSWIREAQKVALKGWWRLRGLRPSLVK